MDIACDRQATMLTVDMGEMEPLSLALGSLDAALSDFRECEVALFEDWDYEFPVETPSTPATIENGWDVVRATIRPAAMLINRSSQMVQVRLLVNEQGEVEDCVLQSPSWRPRDVRGLCRAFTDLGEYVPARHEVGETVPSMVRGYYMMLIYD